MYLDGDRLVVSPTDLVAHLHCPHLDELSLDVVRGVRTRPADDDPDLGVLQRRGLEHEHAYLKQLGHAGTVVVEIADGPLVDQLRQTLEALAAGPDAIYQAAFFDDTGDGPAWRGHADFLHRVDVRSTLGAYSYEPSDTKLARRVKPGAVIQLCAYAAQLARAQGKEPEHVHVVLGGVEHVTLRLADFAAYFRQAREGFEHALRAGGRSYPLPNQHCPVCPWHAGCEDRWRRDDHLVLVAGLRLDQARRLEAAGIPTAGALAAFRGGRVPGMAPATLDKLRHQAELQRTPTADGRPAYDLLGTAGEGLGLAALPAPSRGDVFFDIEGDPHVQPAGIEYLLGAGWDEQGADFGYRPFWAHDAAAEKRSFEAFIDFVTERRAADPGMHVYHFAAYETTAVGRLMARHGTREAEVDELLRAGVFVDLYRIVRQAVRVGTPSYSLKQLEALYMEDRRSDAIVDAGSSIVEYERWLQTAEPSILDDLAAYNRTDCQSTSLLRDWLEERRAEYADTFGVEPPRPRSRDGSAPEAVQEEGELNDALAAALRTPDAERGPAEGRARQLLADLLEWHRREDKPAWWKYFALINDFDDDDLFEDTECLAGLEYAGTAGAVRRSVVHRYRFDPAQEHKFKEGDEPLDPAVERASGNGEKRPGPGTIHHLDARDGIVELVRGATSTAAHPRALIPQTPIRTTAQRRALRRLGTAVVDAGVDGPGPYRAARDLLLRCPPRRRSAPFGSSAKPSLVEHSLAGPGERPADAAVRLSCELADGCLGIQGPPGSGKTTAAGRIAVALLAQGRRVGVTAQSHAVITNLLCRILAHAESAGVEVRCSQRASTEQGLAHDAVTVRTSAKAAEDDLASGFNLFAGTSWLFARPAFDQAIDCLIVDEAGQLSLANTLAVATSARNLVLVGDPRQLAQPSQGTHPDGAGASALEHLLGDHDTMPEGLGVFLDRSHRLHPGICAFVSEIVYEGRLESDPECARQRTVGPGTVSGSGLRWRPIDHSGNRTSSDEEVMEVARIHGELLRQTFTDRDGRTRPIGLQDVLVVAPYNAQVSAIARMLPRGARVGTVDKFQGQEAPVVIVSLATSSLDEIPRGMEFLFSRNRLNVAVSRAQALAVVVASPTLLSVRCHTVEQLRLANGLCRLVELAV